MKKEKPHLDHKEVIKAMGLEWAAMDATAKAPFEKLSAEAKTQYEKDMAAYKAKTSGNSTQSVDKKSKAAAPAPKK